MVFKLLNYRPDTFQILVGIADKNIGHESPVDSVIATFLYSHAI